MDPIEQKKPTRDFIFNSLTKKEVRHEEIFNFGSTLVGVSRHGSCRLTRREQQGGYVYAKP